MSQTTPNQATAANKKAYHTPQLRKFGKVSELTFSNSTPSGSLDGGSSAPNLHAS
jgi:hypothetical protein